MKKKLLLLLITVILGIFVMGITASAATYGKLTYKVSKGEVAITSCSSSASGSLTIPDKINGYPVTTIGDDAFYNCYSLTSITIGDSVTIIGDCAFSGCTSLTSITIPNSVTTIGDRAFADCYSLISVTIPNSVTTIGDCTFDNCYSLTSITIPDSVTTIGDYAFGWCDSLTSVTIPDSATAIGNGAFFSCRSLTGITIPDSVTTIGDDAFYRCYSMTSIVVDGDNQYYSSLNGNLYNKNQTTLIQYAIGKSDTSFTIPNSVTTIGNGAFSECDSLTGITIGDSVTAIGDWAFDSCESLISITIPDGVTIIGVGAFSSCYRLTSIVVDGDNQYYSSLNGNLYNKNQTTLIQYAIGKSDTSFAIPDSVTTIDDSAFYSCTSLASITIPDRVTTIGGLAFDSCESLTSITIGDSVTTIGNDAFYGCRSLTDVYYSGTEEEWNAISIGWDNDCLTNATIHYAKVFYTYTFLDSDGSVIAEATAEKGATITPPYAPADKGALTFDYWQGYTDGMTLTGDITFTAVYKYKDYYIYADGIAITVTYGSDFTIPTEEKDGYAFKGYFAEQDGKGTQITDEFGNSLKPYQVIGDLTVYPYFVSEYLNKAVLVGDAYGDIGGTISPKLTFATDKEAIYLVLTIKYPAFLNYKGKKEIDFAEVYQDSIRESGDFKYIDFTCIYDYDGNNIPAQENITPFELEFEIPANATVGNGEITVENVILVGDEIHSISDIVAYCFEINPKLAERIEIVGSATIDAPTQFTAKFFPDYTTNKTVAWSVSDTSIATISEDGVLTPVKNGTVTITATAKDGSGVSASKTISIVTSAKLSSLDFGAGVCFADFDENVREYTVYVKADMAAISLTPTYTGGVLRPNGSGIWVSGMTKEFALSDSEPTVITLHRQNVSNMSNSVYTITVVKLDSTIANVSEDGKNFDIISPSAEAGNVVVLALYNGERFVEAQSAVYDGDKVSFTTDKAYTYGKVMIFSSLSGLEPVCNSEVIGD